MIKDIVRILRGEDKVVDYPFGKIIARNDRLDEIMVTEPNGKTERYKKVNYEEVCNGISIRW